MANVFISYKREDREWAVQLSALLEQAGFSTWWDTSLLAGEHFVERIQKELADAEVVLVIWSRSSAASKWVRAEALEAFNQSKLISVRIDQVFLGVPFNAVHTMDISGINSLYTSKQTGDLIASIQELCKPKREQVQLLFFWFNDGFANAEAGLGFCYNIQQFCEGRGIDLEIVPATELAINLPEDKLKTLDGKPTFFLELGSVDEYSGFYQDVVEPGMNKLCQRFDPKKTFYIRKEYLEQNIHTISPERKIDLIFEITEIIESKIKLT